MTCCGKMICCGCIHAVKTRTKKHSLCAFCRTPNANSSEDDIGRMNKRLELGDPIAMYNIGGKYYLGDDGFPQNYAKALEFYDRARELGHTSACCNIGYAYSNGEGVDMDKKKAEHYWELAAMRGDEMARHNLGCIEEKAGNWDRAIKHWMIAAQGGEADSLRNIRCSFKNGHATKEDYTAALQGYQAYLDEVKSVQRDEAAAARDEYKYIE